MKLVFAHDHKLRKIDGKYYTVGGLRDSITARYMEFFDEMTIFCRAIEKQPYDTQLFELKNPKITVKPVSSGSLILSRDVKKMMEEEIKNADGLIVKLHSRIAEQAICYARKYDIPYLVESVACPWDSYWNHSVKGKIVAPWMTLSTKREIRRSPFVIYLTKEFLETKYPWNGKWINCSDAELQGMDTSVLNRRIEKIKHMGSEITLGTLAQVDIPYKGQKYVIKAIAELKKQGKVFKYRLAGSGEDTYLRKIAAEYGVSNQIEFCGVLPHDEVFFWLDDLDFYVQPSKTEGLPRALIEAISRACPAAGSNVGGIGELLDDDFLFTKCSVSQIKNILSGLNKEIMIAAAKRNFEKAKCYETNYLNQKRNSFYQEFYEQCYDVACEKGKL